MPDPKNPRRENPSTYFVQDRQNQDEMTRVQIQGQMVTAAMGGPLPEQPNPAIFERILDVGCGTGDWLIEVAKTYPAVKKLIGVDVSDKVLDYARAQAKAERVADRVEFLTMDALALLDFPAGYFDLVNQRFGMSYLRTWDWPKLLRGYQEVSRKGGVIRVTECKIGVDGNSPALTEIFVYILDAFYQAGHFFTESRDGVITQLARVLTQHGVQDVQTRTHILEYHAGTPATQSFYEDMSHLFRTVVPFLRKWSRVPDNYDELCQQALEEMRSPDFMATWELLTAWGTSLGPDDPKASVPKK